MVILQSTIYIYIYKQQQQTLSESPAPLHCIGSKYSYRMDIGHWQGHVTLCKLTQETFEKDWRDTLGKIEETL